MNPTQAAIFHTLWSLYSTYNLLNCFNTVVSIYLMGAVFTLFADFTYFTITMYTKLFDFMASNSLMPVIMTSSFRTWH